MNKRDYITWTCMALALTGCAPPTFVDLPPHYTPSYLVEQEVIEQQGILAPSVRRVPVLSDQIAPAQRMHSNERVRWLSGPSEADRRVQLPSEQHVAEAFTEIPAEAPKAVESSEDQVTFFFVDEEWQLTTDANAKTLAFKARPGAMYQARFQFSGGIDPIAAHEMTVTWNGFVDRLLSRGMKRGQIVLASPQYHQPRDAIAIAIVDQSEETP